MVKDTLVKAGINLNTSVSDYGDEAIAMIEDLITNELSEYSMAAKLVIKRLRDAMMMDT